MKKLLAIALMLTMVLSGAVLAETGETNPSVGSVVTFGSYEQDNDETNGKEPIEWIILDVNADGSYVMISKYALDCKPYNTESTEVTWETCTLRKWLNEEFYSVAFCAEEQARIVQTELLNESNPAFGTPGGESTFDNVWLLSIHEVCDYFGGDRLLPYFTDDASRMCAPTDYAVAQGAYQSLSFSVDGTGSCVWWLCSPGGTPWNAAAVYKEGHVDCYSGDGVSNSDVAVRPVLVILP